MMTILYFVSEMLTIEPVDGVQISSHLYNFLQENSYRFLGVFVVSAGSFFLFSLLMSLFFSHKIAGPLFRLHMYLINNSKSGEKIPKLTFRQGDFFQEIPEEFNKFAKAKGIDG
ncbi:MAG: hypothetical protein K2Q18_14230 [Bdellovibrionales bacterium]|nr:hypothetical protein [Bdellovibrionales bacterium]